MNPGVNGQEILLSAFCARQAAWNARSQLSDGRGTPIVWRDSYKHDFMHHLIGSFDWDPLDFLIIDMPPGTGNDFIIAARTDQLQSS